MKKPSSHRRLLKAKRPQILRIARRYGADNIRIFGSIARGDFNKKSDFDFLVKMHKGRSLLDLVGMWQDLEDLLGRKVDVVSEGGVSPYLRERIFSEARPL